MKFSYDCVRQSAFTTDIESYDEVRYDLSLLQHNPQIFKDLCEKYPNKCFVFETNVFDMPDMKDWFFEDTLKALMALVELSNNYNIKLAVYFQHLFSVLSWQTIFREYCPNVKYYLNNKITTWAQLKGIINDYDICDVWIAEELAFDMINVSDYSKQHNKEIRVYANVLQSSYYNTPDYQKFFIRPEAIKLYEPLVDTVMFYHVKSQKTVIDVYKNDQKWYGELGDLINGLSYNTGLNGQTLNFTFDKIRVNCGCKCLSGRKCDICKSLMELSNTLKDNNIYIRKDNKNNGSKGRAGEERVNSDNIENNT